MRAQVGHVYGRAVERGAVVLLGGARTHPEWQGADKRVFNSLGFAMGVELGCLARARPTRYLNVRLPHRVTVLPVVTVLYIRSTLFSCLHLWRTGR